MMSRGICIVGNPSGLLGLAVMYFTGHGVAVDYVLASRLIRRAIDQGSDWVGISDAYFYSGTLTGDIHPRGKGRPRITI